MDSLYCKPICYQLRMSGFSSTDHPLRDALSSFKLGNQDQTLVAAYLTSHWHFALQVQVVHAASRAREADVEDSAKGKCIGLSLLASCISARVDCLTSRFVLG